jgi:hypothetical protein
MHIRYAASATRPVQLRNGEIRQARPDVIPHDTGDEQSFCSLRHHALKEIKYSNSQKDDKLSLLNLHYGCITNCLDYTDRESS